MFVSLKEREEDMKLAIEERELQKMAALSQQDNKTDELRQVITDLNAVSVICCFSVSW